MSIARLVLEYLDALKWPILALVALVIFRKPISELIDRVRTMKATVGASSVEVDAARRGLEMVTEEAIDSTSEVLSEVIVGRPSPGGLETRGGETRGASATPEEYAAAGVARSRFTPEQRQQLVRIVERRRQREIEAVIRAAVDYGWLTALKEPNGPRPVPVIEWTEDGKPRITTFTTTETAEAQRLPT